MGQKSKKNIQKSDLLIKFQHEDMVENRGDIYIHIKIKTLE